MNTCECGLNWDWAECECEKESLLNIWNDQDFTEDTHIYRFEDVPGFNYVWNECECGSSYCDDGRPLTGKCPCQWTEEEKALERRLNWADIEHQTLMAQRAGIKAKREQRAVSH